MSNIQHVVTNANLFPTASRIPTCQPLIGFLAYRTDVLFCIINIRFPPLSQISRYKSGNMIPPVA